MNEGTNKDRSPDVDVRRKAGIVRSPLDEIKAIQTLLADVYKDAGDGRTLFRELVQNADDAGARRLRLTVLERGWPDAPNSLLRGPALLVANDGPFPAKDREALHKAIGGSKEDDASKIGTFGIGLKSVFHICEAFIYIGAEKSEWRAGVLNPWAGTGESGEADPVHPEWAEVDERLQAVATELIGDTSSGLMLWIPLRRPEHLDRGVDGSEYGVGQRCTEPEELCAWFGNSASPALLLAQCGHLKSIEVHLTVGPESLHDPQRLARVDRKKDEWVGRHKDDSHERTTRPFKGTIESDERSWYVVGIEALGGDSLRKIRSQPNWPQSPQWYDGRHSTVPRKALAHAAISVLRPDATNTELLGTRIRWAVFLPLDDDPEPRSSEIVESAGTSPTWEIILHGYFWPSQDRRSIPDVTDVLGNRAGETDMRNRWNRAVCDDLLLPLLPSALARAVDGIEERVARRLLDTVANSKIVLHRSDAVKRRHWLLPLVAADGVQWEARDPKECRVLSIPKWSRAPVVVRRQFLATWDQCTDDVVFIDDDAPRLVGELDDWTVDHLERLLNSIPNDAFAAPQDMKWIGQIIRHVLGEYASGGDILPVLVVRWIVERIGQGVLTQTTRRVSDESQRIAREELRYAWRYLLAALPNEWLLDAPLESQRAVAELAAEGVIGEGLVPVPFGNELESLPSRPDPKRLDNALRVLGRRLAAGGESERLRHSRLLLAETLLSIRDDNLPLNDLETLPLLRVTRMPEDREEAWSVYKLRRQTNTRRVFASQPSVKDSDVHQPGRLLDPKRAVAELATAIDEDIWIVVDARVAALAGTPSPTPDALARTVIGAKTFHPEPTQRKHLVVRLAQDGGTHVCAVRALLTGRCTAVVGQDTELFFAPRQSLHEQQTLDILLRLLCQSWRAVDVELEESLSHNLVQDLSVSRADARALHRLLNDCLSETVNWAGLSDEEVLHLLQHLYGGMAEDQERWRTMPLHRDVCGRRGPFDARALRTTEGSDKLQLPPELDVTVRLLDPDPSVAHLYASVPVMARDGVLRLMLEDDIPWRFAKRIAQSVRSADGQMTLPQDSDLRERLRHTCWLPVGNDDGVAPEAVLIAPEELLKKVSGLAVAGALGDKRLPKDVHPETWQIAERVVREILGRLSQDRQVQRIADALNPDQVAQVSGGAYLVMPDPELVDASLIEDALKTTLVDSHLGWKLVNTVKRVLGHSGGAGPRDASEPLLKLVKALCAPLPPAHQITMLKVLAQSRPVKESPGGRLFRELLDCFAKTDEFYKHVLSEIELPTQDGNWHASRDVARSESGVARRHRLIPELRSNLRLSGDHPVPQTSNVGSGESESESDALEALEKYFEPWRHRVPHGAVGAFLSLLGNGLRDSIANLAEQWLGEDVSLEGLRSKLAAPNGSVPFAGVNVWVKPDFARGDRVTAMNVIGSWVEMEVDADNETLLAVDPAEYHPTWPSALLREFEGPFWEITLRDVDLHGRTSSDLVSLLGCTVEKWAVRFLKLDRDKVKTWWSQWGKGSQADLGPVRASIKAHLPLTLRHLDVQEQGSLQDALRAAERAQRKREQTPEKATLRAEREALDRLARLIDEPELKKFIWRRVNKLMRRNGYGPESVLLELAQNADDALAQAAEIKGGPLPPATCRLLIRVHEHDGTPTLDITHWGRPINDTGGPAFPEGRERQWDQDLYFMMLMNLSGKPGEAPGRAASASTTGRFGLGFKSVHLVSESPSVVSGFINFSIAGGLLPQERPVENEADESMIEGRRATRVRLPLRGMSKRAL